MNFNGDYYQGIYQYAQKFDLNSFLYYCQNGLIFDEKNRKELKNASDKNNFDIARLTHFLFTTTTPLFNCTPDHYLYTCSCEALEISCGQPRNQIKWSSATAFEYQHAGLIYQNYKINGGTENDALFAKQNFMELCYQIKLQTRQKTHFYDPYLYLNQNLSTISD
jgi:hypothetical protein